MAYEDALRRVLVRLDEARRTMPGLSETEISQRVDHLLDLDAERRDLLLRRSYKRWNDPRLCLELLQRVRQSKASDPLGSRRVLEIAQQVLGRCRLHDGIAALLFDLRATAKAFEATFDRIEGSYFEAELKIEAALSYCAMGTKSPDVVAEILSEQASLARDLRRFEQARSLCLRAARLMQQAGDRRAAGLIYVQLGAVERDSGNLESALQATERAFEHLDLTNQPVLASRIHGNLALYLAESGETARAWEVLGPHRADTYPPGRERAQAYWREGTMFQCDRRLGEAITSFSIALEGYEQAGEAHNYALVAIDLALALLETGQFEAVGPLAIEAGQVLAVLGVTRDALAAWSLLIAASRHREHLESFLLRLKNQVEESRHWAAPAMLPS